MLSWLLRKIQFSPIFYTQNENFLIFEGVLNYDVIVTSYINERYLFWKQWKEDIHSW